MLHNNPNGALYIRAPFFLPSIDAPHLITPSHTSQTLKIPVDSHKHPHKKGH